MSDRERSRLNFLRTQRGGLREQFFVLAIQAVSETGGEHMIEAVWRAKVGPLVTLVSIAAQLSALAQYFMMIFFSAITSRIKYHLIAMCFVR